MRAFPMIETNDVSNEFKFAHFLMLACVLAIMLMGWAPTGCNLGKVIVVLEFDARIPNQDKSRFTTILPVGLLKLKLQR